MPVFLWLWVFVAHPLYCEALFQSSCWQAGMDQNMTLKRGEKCKMNLHLMFVIKHIVTLIYKNKMQLKFLKISI